MIPLPTRKALNALVALTRRFQHLAFGAALALLGDFHQADDAVQEAFLSEWSALPALSDPGAFPGWLRGIVRHHAFRTLRHRHLDLVPLEAAEDIPSDSRPADDQLDQKQHSVAALAGTSHIPAYQREGDPPGELLCVRRPPGARRSSAPSAARYSGPDGTSPNPNSPARVSRVGCLTSQRAMCRDANTGRATITSRFR